MNPITNMKNVKKLSEQELQTNSKSSWHDQYRDSAWIFVGGLPYDVTEGDIVCIFSQYGEIVNLNLIRDKDTGKSKGFCFICYEDQRSTVLAVDNFNGIKLLGRIIRVDHVSNYKIPKEGKQTDEETKRLYQEGCAPKVEVPQDAIPFMPVPDDVRETLADQISGDIRLPPRLPICPIKEEVVSIKSEEKVKVKKEKKNKHKKKKKKSRKTKVVSPNDSSDSDSSNSEKDRHKRSKKYKIDEEHKKSSSSFLESKRSKK